MKFKSKIILVILSLLVTLIPVWAFASPSDSITIKVTIDSPPQITSVTPADGSVYYENDAVMISTVVNDSDPSPLEYQFSIDEVIKQAWSNQANYSWTAMSGIHNLKVEVRDTGGQDTKQVEICVFRIAVGSPIGPPE